MTFNGILDTNTARFMTEREMLAMLPPDEAADTAKGPFDQGGPSCNWFERIFDAIFPPDKSQESAPPCGAFR